MAFSSRDQMCITCGFKIPAGKPFIEECGVTKCIYCVSEPKDTHGMYTENENNPPDNQWKPRLLEAAIEATTGARNKDYGNPWENHNRTAELWAFWLRNSKGIDVILTDLDVCMFNMLQKISRLTNGVEHYDSWVDLAGYAGNAGVCMDVHSGKIKVSGVPQDEIGEL